MHVCKYILGCFVTTFDEPVCANLGLKTLKNMRDFHKLQWYFMVMSMNGERLSVKLLKNKWDKEHCKGHSRKSWLAQVDF